MRKQSLIKSLTVVFLICGLITSILSCDIGMKSSEDVFRAEFVVSSSDSFRDALAKITGSNSKYNLSEVKFNEIKFPINFICDYVSKFNEFPKYIILNISNCYDIFTNGSESYFKSEYIKEVKLPGYIEKIGEYAFYNCSDLNGIEIPDTVKKIEKYAFYGCSGFTSITIPSNVTEIEAFAFQNCTGLTDVKIPKGVKKLGIYSFDCSSITSITVPNSLEEIAWAFTHCPITKITFIGDNTITSGYGTNDYRLEDIIVDGKIPSGTYEFTKEPDTSLYWKKIE